MNVENKSMKTREIKKKGKEIEQGGGGGVHSFAFRLPFPSLPALQKCRFEIWHLSTYVCSSSIDFKILIIKYNKAADMIHLPFPALPLSFH